MIITIDGPTASGKSTVAKLVAQKLNYVHLNSGLLYRGIAYVLVHFLNYTQEQLANPKQADLDYIINNHKLVYHDINHQAQVLYDHQDITPYLKTKTMDNYASISSAAPQVRASLMQLQRQVGAWQNVVAEGRDTGTQVFPNASLKIFLTASLPVRAKRWQDFMHKTGKYYSLRECEKLINERDQRDINRHVAPLMPAPDAIIIDSSNLDIDQVIYQIYALLEVGH
jgi:CMP/dCMP kinase